MNISMNETSVNKSLSEWAGFSKQPEIANYLRWYIGLFIVIAFELIANLRNKHYRQQNNQVAPAYPIVFPGATRDRADESLSSCAKFMANHIFYKFGLEISFTMTAVVVSVRMDGLAALYTSFLLCLVFMKRAHIARLWGLYLTILAVLLPLQYASRLGLPPSLCIQLPWNLPSNLALWLFLPSYTNELQPNEIFLVADFFQLLLVSCQLYVFKMENSVGPATEGGDNSEVRWQEDGILVKPNREIPVADFTGTNRSTYIDWLKDATFQYFHWVTLVVVFSAAVAGISIFAFGYLLGCFLLLWKGEKDVINWIKVQLSFTNFRKRHFYQSSPACYAKMVPSACVLSSSDAIQSVHTTARMCLLSNASKQQSLLADATLLGCLYQRFSPTWNRGKLHCYGIRGQNDLGRDGDVFSSHSAEDFW